MYKGYLLGQYVDEVVAIKTLKGLARFKINDHDQVNVYFVICMHNHRLH